MKSEDRHKDFEILDKLGSKSSKNLRSREQYGYESLQ